MNDLIQSKKYLDIFDTAKDLFWKYVIKRVTIEEICKEAGVSKMTFYKFFRNKIELAKVILKIVIGNSLEKFEQIVNGDLDFHDKVKEMFLIKLESTKDISVEFISDIYKIQDANLHLIINEQRQKSLKIFVDFLIDSQKNGLIREDLRIEFILYYFEQMTHMMDNKDLVAKYDHPQDLIMESMRFLFYGLFPRK